MILYLKLVAIIKSKTILRHISLLAESVSGSIPTSSGEVPQPLDTSTEESLIIAGSNVDVKLKSGQGVDKFKLKTRNIKL